MKLHTHKTTLVLALLASMQFTTAQAEEAKAAAEMRCGASMKMNDTKDKASDSSDMNMNMDMNMQGGPAPADARDPHAFSGGYPLQSLNPERQLKLMDEKNLGTIVFDELERVDADHPTTAFNAHAKYGRDYDKLVLMAEGEVEKGKVAETMLGIYWGHAIVTYWDTLLGVRRDAGMEENRYWLGGGVQGLAPYWFEMHALVYVGSDSRTALRLEAEYELLFTQRLILQPAVELNAYGKSDAVNELGSGIADVTTGLRLRYEITRQFAPYVGVENKKLFGNTANMARDMSIPTSDTSWVAGIRFWF